jgi:hypothetical protein
LFYWKDNHIPILLWLIGIPIPLIILILLLRQAKHAERNPPCAGGFFRNHLHGFVAGGT